MSDELTTEEIRDYYAGQALMGMVGAAAFNQDAEDMMKKAGINVEKDVEAFVATMAFDFADAMMKERKLREIPE